MTPEIRISVLSRTNMGELSRVVDVPGEALLRSLASNPTETVAAVCDDSTWPATEARIVAELAAAPDQATRNEVKRQIPALVPARFKASARNTAECLGRQVIGHDFDHVVADTFETACGAIRAQLPDRFLAIHTTATERNPDGTWRLRAFEILQPEPSPAEWEQRVKPHMRTLGEHDPAALDVARLLYMPIKTAGYRFAVFEGPRTKLESLPLVAAPVEASALRTAMAPSAPADAWRKATAILGAALPPEGQGRHLAQRALAGGLVHDDLNEADAIEFLCGVYRAAGDEDREKRTKTVRDTLKRKAAGKSYDGWPTLERYVGRGVVSDVRAILNGTAAMEARLAEVAAQTAKVEPEGLGFKYGAWDTKPPPIKFLVDGLLPRACVGMLFGRADTLKTWILFSLGIAVASGKPWLDRFNVQHAKVGLVDYETGDGNVHRRLYMLRAGENPNLGAKSFAKLKPNDPAFWDALALEGFDLVIIDSLRKANPGANEDKSGEAIVPLELAAEFSEKTGCAVVFIHHAKKSTSDGWPEFRGSGAIEDQVDCAFAVRKTDVSADRKTVEVRCEKPGDMRMPAPFTVEVTFDDAEGLATLRHVEPAPQADAKGNESSEALQAAIRLALASGPVAGVKALARKLGKQAARVGVELALMVERREVVKTDEGYQLDDDAKRRARVLAFVEKHGHESRFNSATRLAKAAHVAPGDVERLLLEHVIVRAVGGDAGGFVPGRLWDSGSGLPVLGTRNREPLREGATTPTNGSRATAHD